MARKYNFSVGDVVQDSFGFYKVVALLTGHKYEVIAEPASGPYPTVLIKPERGLTIVRRASARKSNPKPRATKPKAKKNPKLLGWNRAIKGKTRGYPLVGPTVWYTITRGPNGMWFEVECEGYVVGSKGTLGLAKELAEAHERKRVASALKTNPFGEGYHPGQAFLRSPTASALAGSAGRGQLGSSGYRVGGSAAEESYFARENERALARMRKHNPAVWTHTHDAKRTNGRTVQVCYDPLSRQYLTRSEWKKVYAGGTPDLPPGRYTSVKPAGKRNPKPPRGAGVNARGGWQQPRPGTWLAHYANGPSFVIEREGLTYTLIQGRWSKAANGMKTTVTLGGYRTLSDAQQAAASARSRWRGGQRSNPAKRSRRAKRVNLFGSR